MRRVIIGAHLRREDVEPLAEALPVREVFLSGVPIANEQTLGERELLLRVAQIRGRLLERATFVAIRYGFAVWSADEAEAKCATYLARWKSLLEAHREHVEMTLKIAVDGARPRPSRHEFSSGADYLRALHEATRAVSIDPQFRNDVDTSLVPLTLKSRWLHRDEKSVELAMLVERSRVEEIHAAGESLRRSGVAFLLSGPWPLEVFADDDHE